MTSGISWGTIEDVPDEFWGVLEEQPEAVTLLLTGQRDPEDDGIWVLDADGWHRAAGEEGEARDDD